MRVARERERDRFTAAAPRVAYRGRRGAREREDGRHRQCGGRRRRRWRAAGGVPTRAHAACVAVDSDGRVYVGIATGVQVFSPKGEPLGVIPTSQRPQNLAFAGPDKQTLYLAGGSALFSVKMLAKGYSGRAK